MRKITLLLVSMALCFGTVKAQLSIAASEACYGTLTGMQGINASTDTVSSWTWDFDGDGAFDDAWGETTNYIFGDTTSLTVGLKVTFTNGSSDSTTQNIIINPLPQVNFYVDNLCAKDSAIFTDNSSILSGGIEYYYWDFNNDGSDDDEGQIVKYTNGSAPGFYVTTLRGVSFKGCSSSTSKQNEVFPTPVSSFNTVGSVMVGESTVFVNSSTILSGLLEIYLWDFGDGTGSSVIAPSHDFDTAITFTVQLVTISDQDCRDTITQEITVAEGIDLSVEQGLGIESSVVTPNGDNINDFLVIRELSKYEGCSVSVYNRWNDSVYTSDKYDNVEENSFPQGDLDAGAYYYIINCDGTQVMGVFNILR